MNSRWADMWLFLILTALAGWQQSDRIDLTGADKSFLKSSA